MRRDGEVEEMEGSGEEGRLRHRREGESVVCFHGGFS